MLKKQKIDDDGMVLGLSENNRVSRVERVLPIIKIKSKKNKKRIYLFGIVPLFKVVYGNDNIIKLYIFDIIPLFKIVNKSRVEKIYLFNYFLIFILFSRKSLQNKKINVLFEVVGGYGDILIGLNYILNLKEKFGDVIDINLTTDKKRFEDIKLFLNKQNFYNKIYVNKNKISSKFDVVINLSRTLYIEYFGLDKNYREDNPFCEYLCNYIQSINNTANGYVKIAGNYEQIMEKYSLLQGRNRVQQADIDGSIGVKSKLKINLENEDKILEKFNLKNIKYITIQNGSGKGLEGMNYTRLYPDEKFSKLIDLIKQNYNNYKIIQFGYKDNEVLDKVDISLCGETSFEEMLVILKNSSLHISTESGSIHFRHFLCGKPSLVIFGPTNKNFYGYDENINISSPKQCFGCGCEWITRDWCNKCAKTGSTTDIPCMDIKPKDIFIKLQKSGVLENE